MLCSDYYLLGGDNQGTCLLRLGRQVSDAFKRGAAARHQPDAAVGVRIRVRIRVSVRVRFGVRARVRVGVRVRVGHSG